MSADLTDADTRLPFPQFVRKALAWVAHGGPDPTESELFLLARAIKSHPDALGMGPAPALEAVVAIVDADNGAPLDWIDFGTEDVEVQFHSAWERARFPLGVDPIMVACEMVGDGALSTAIKRPGRYSRFLTAAAALQLMRAQRPILLPTRKLAEHMPCQPNTAASWIGWAIQDRVLVKTREHAFRSQGESKAAEYVFGLHRWDRDAIQRVADLVGVRAPTAVIRWTEEQFASQAGTE